MEVALKIEGLKVFYGAINALKSIDITVHKGQIVGLLGSNGAGKTTTLRTISGLVSATEGKIIFQGKEIQNLEPEKITKMGIAHSPEGRQIFKDLTVEENLLVGAFTQKNKQKIKEKTEECYNYFPRLRERKKQMAGTLSGGEQQMLAIARALMSDNDFIILDEPSLGLAPLIVKEIFAIVKKINEQGKTVLIVEQNAFQTLKIADYGYVLEVGQIAMEGKAQDLLRDEKLIETYLGN